MSDKDSKEPRTLADYIAANPPAEPDICAPVQAEPPAVTEIIEGEGQLSEPDADAILGVALMAKIVVGCIIALIILRLDARLMLPFILCVATLISYKSWSSTQDED